MIAAGPDPRPLLTGIWLSADPIRVPVERLLADMLAPELPSPRLRDAEVDELRRGVKRAEVILEYLDLQVVAVDTDGAVPLRVVAPRRARHAWRNALLVPGGDQPIGLVMNAADERPLVLVHQVVTGFGAEERALVRRYAARAAGGEPHDEIAAALGAEPEFLRVLRAARRQVQMLDPAVLWSPDGATRVQLGSISQTMKDILREGYEADQLFVLPANLFEGKTNHGDIEFLVYLNFFLRQRLRTRIAGTARQRRVLHRLLTVTLFGPFDPAAPAPAPFAELRERWGVESREAYEFLLAAYRLYAERGGPDTDGRILGIDAYVDFTGLDGPETAVALPAAEVHLEPREHGVQARIVQPDGRESAKRLEVGVPPRLFRAIPDDLRAAIQFATDRPRFGVTPLGTSHGFDPDGDFTSFVVWINGKGILVDPSPEALAYLAQAGVAPVDVPYVFLTHVHADHDGGLIEKLLGGSRTTVIASDPVFRAFAEKARLITGHDFEREGLVKHLPANPGRPVPIAAAGEFAELETRWNLHPIPTNGFRIAFDGRSFGYSADTQYDPALLERLRAEQRIPGALLDDLAGFFWSPDGRPTVDLLFHEAGLAPIHTDRQAVAGLPEAVTARTALVHVADRDVPPGFQPGKPRLFGTHVLAPGTAGSRERVLLETLRLVAYLYDIPTDTLETLLRNGEIVEHPAGAVLVRKGPVSRTDAFDFQIITDGQVGVRDGRRSIARLGKADTFGEWGISHQRGFRVADVVADRPTQTLVLTEAQYHWLVGRHPVVQERISRIRSLLPRLQVAQERVRLKAEAEPGPPSVIEHMTSNQLSSFAIFSRARRFRQGQAILVRGEPADGFYVLLSGHLSVRIEGTAVGELGEGDVFGEMGLLRGGTREADVVVVSADAEVLCTSSRSFLKLLRTVPAFAWGIRETATDRRRRLAARRSAAPC